MVVYVRGKEEYITKLNYKRNYGSDTVVLNSYKTSSYKRRNQKVRLKLHIVKKRLNYTYKDLERAVMIKKAILINLLNGRDIKEDNLIKIEKYLNNL